MGYGTSLGTAHEDEISYVIEKGMTDKQLADASEINQNSTSGDFRSRFDVPMPSTMPLEDARKLTDALKLKGATQVASENKPLSEAPIQLETDYVNKLQEGNTKTMDFIFGKPDTPSDIRPALGHFYDTVKNAFKLPGDVYSSKVPAGSVQEIERAADLAGLMITGPAPVAAKVADGSLGSFMGVKSKTIDKNRLYQAQNMQLKGILPDEIYAETSTFKGADSRWRQEINDKSSSLKEEHLNVSPATPDEGWTSLGKDKTVSIPSRYANLINDPSIENLLKSFSKPDNQKVLGHILNHPDLYNAYPWLQNVKVYPLPKESPYYGFARTGEGQMEIHMSELAPDEFHSTLMHEVQHLIQAHEGFASGGSPKMFLPKELEAAEENFLKVRKEALANTEKELSMPTEQVADFKRAVQQDVEGTLRPESSGRIKIDFLKSKHPEIYDRLSNIVKSEKLLFDAKQAAQEKYKSIMGEVEARNVQARMHMDEVLRRWSDPVKTEEAIVSRLNQISSPADGPSASEITPMRRGANDNPTPKEQEADRLLRKAKRMEESDKIYSEFLKTKRKLDAKIASRPPQEAIDTAKKESEKLRTVLETRDWSEIEQAKYDKLQATIWWFAPK